MIWFRHRVTWIILYCLEERKSSVKCLNQPRNNWDMHGVWLYSQFGASSGRIVNLPTTGFVRSNTGWAMLMNYPFSVWSVSIWSKLTTCNITDRHGRNNMDIPDLRPESSKPSDAPLPWGIILVDHYSWEDGRMSPSYPRVYISTIMPEVKLEPRSPSIHL